jgi:DNA invertase Pin-like site-specific DNA recombinase
MFQQPHFPESASVIVVGYVRRSSEMQKDNYSIDAQKRAIRDACKIRDLPASFTVPYCFCLVI